MGFGKELKRLREETNMPAAKLAKIIGVDAERLRKWEQKDLTPRDEDTVIIERFFNKSLDEIGKLKSIKEFLKVPNTPKSDADSFEKTKDLLKSKVGDDDVMQTIKDLAKSSIIYAEAHRDLIQTHKMAVETNSELTQLLKTRTTIVNDDQQKIEVLNANMKAVHQLLMLIGSGKRWHSPEEVKANLGRLFLEASSV